MWGLGNRRRNQTPLWWEFGCRVKKACVCVSVSVCMCVFMDINTSEKNWSGAQRAQSRIPPTSIDTQNTDRNDTTKRVTIGRIGDEERRGEERRTYVEWVDKQGRQGRGYDWQKSHTHTHTHQCTCKSLCHLQRWLPCQSSCPTKAHQPFFPFFSVSPTFFDALYLFFMLPCLVCPVKIAERAGVCPYCTYTRQSICVCMHAPVCVCVCVRVCVCVCVCFSSVCRDLSHGYHELMSSI